MLKGAQTCGPCSLCNQTSNRYFHTCIWGERKYGRFITIVYPHIVKHYDHICICRACHHDLDNNIGNESHAQPTMAKTTSMYRNLL